MSKNTSKMYKNIDNNQKPKVYFQTIEMYFLQVSKYLNKKVF